MQDVDLPDQLPDAQEDAELFKDHPWIEPPIRIDYGTNIRLGKGVFLNYNMVIVDTCLVSIGDRTLVGPNCSIYSGTHPVDPALRNGTAGLELGKEVHIEEDCWLGGNVIICPGVRVGRGSTIGAGSVVTKVSPCQATFILKNAWLSDTFFVGYPSFSCSSR
jgi:acetyltransferase-like isoleucine patch superfamily enzyme